MIALPDNELMHLLLSIGALLFMVWVLAFINQKISFPMVMGEILLGIVLGPSIVGALWPELSGWVYPSQGPPGKIFQGITALCLLSLLFVAGLEVNLKLALTQGKTALITSFTSLVIPFAMGLFAVWFWPDLFIFPPEQKNIYAVFFGIALAISALPVVVRILMDLNLYKSKIGTIIVSAAVIDDVIGFLAFAFLLSLMGRPSPESYPWIPSTLVLGFILLLLIMDQEWLSRVFSGFKAGFGIPRSLSLCVVAFLFGSALTVSLNLPPLLGAFSVGLILGTSKQISLQTRDAIQQVVMQIFAPLFFISIGFKMDFIANFDPVLAAVVLGLAIVGKLLGGVLGAYWGGVNRQEALAVGFGLNARGAMEIILGSLALDAGLIDAKMFVALVCMGFVTSMISAPLLKIFSPKVLAASGAGELGVNELPVVSNR